METQKECFKNDTFKILEKENVISDTDKLLTEMRKVVVDLDLGDLGPCTSFLQGLV